MIGDEAAPYRNYLEMSNPTEEAVVKNWEDMKLVWDYGFKKVLLLNICIYCSCFIVVRSHPLERVHYFN